MDAIGRMLLIPQLKIGHFRLQRAAKIKLRHIEQQQLEFTDNWQVCIAQKSSTVVTISIYDQISCKFVVFYSRRVILQKEE